MFIKTGGLIKTMFICFFSILVIEFSDGGEDQSLPYSDKICRVREDISYIVYLLVGQKTTSSHRPHIYKRL